MHSIAAPEDFDHIAVPVPEREISVKYRCDFCFSDDVTSLLPARSFGLAPINKSVEDWAACGECARLIERNQWTALAQRSWDSYRNRHGDVPDDVFLEIKRLHRMLRKNITGPIRPLTQ